MFSSLDVSGTRDVVTCSIASRRALPVFGGVRRRDAIPDTLFYGDTAAKNVQQFTPPPPPPSPPPHNPHNPPPPTPPPPPPTVFRRQDCETTVADWGEVPAVFSVSVPVAWTIGKCRDATYRMEQTLKHVVGNNNQMLQLTSNWSIYCCDVCFRYVAVQQYLDTGSSRRGRAPCGFR